MNGKLIVIEAGTDASGKTTQAAKIYEKLSRLQTNVHQIKFPDYESPSSALVKMYLNGEFGKKPDDVNSYAASTFYAVDRYASYHNKWKNLLEKGSIIIADRYTTSNMVHQASKIASIEKREEFLDWLWDLEFNKLLLPIPDLVLFLNMPPEQSCRLMDNRREQERDIHEQDLDYLINTYQNACWIARKYNWVIINCFENERIKSIEEINQEVFKVIQDRIIEKGDY